MAWWPSTSEIRTLIARMDQENFLWGAPRIHGKLLKLGFKVSQATVSRYMPRRSHPPSQSWRTFLQNQALGISVMGLSEASQRTQQIPWRGKCLALPTIFIGAPLPAAACGSVRSAADKGATAGRWAARHNHRIAQGHRQNGSCANTRSSARSFSHRTRAGSDIYNDMRRADRDLLRFSHTHGNSCVNSEDGPRSLCFDVDKVLRTDRFETCS